ncbi:hypothetical protein [Limnospira indica]|nr:hypothetical protein [Limnospira indica]
MTFLSTPTKIAWFRRLHLWTGCCRQSRTKPEINIKIRLCPVLFKFYRAVIMILMPGKSYRGTLPPLTRHQEELSDRLRQDVEAIAGTGEHNYIYYDNLLKTEAYLEAFTFALEL